MNRLPPLSTPPDTLSPSPTRFRSVFLAIVDARPGQLGLHMDICIGQRLILGRRVPRISQQVMYDLSQLRRIALDDGQFRIELDIDPHAARSEEHTSELQSLMRISYAVFCLKKKNVT